MSIFVAMHDYRRKDGSVRIECPSCGRVTRISESKVSADGRLRFLCSACLRSIRVELIGWQPRAEARP